MESKVVLFSYDSEMEQVCAASMRSCYSRHSSYGLFSYSNEKAGALEGERPFDDQRIHSLLRKTLELEHMDILEHGQLTRTETSVENGTSRTSALGFRTPCLGGQ